MKNDPAFPITIEENPYLPRNTAYIKWGDQIVWITNICDEPAELERENE